MKTTVKNSQVKSLGVAVGLFFVLVATPVLASQGAQNPVADNKTTATTVVVNSNNSNGKTKTTGAGKTTVVTKTTVATKPTTADATTGANGITGANGVTGANGTTVAKVEDGVISMCASTKSSVLRDTANNSCAPGEVKVEWLDTGASPKICVNSNNREMTLAQDGKCVAKNTSAVVVASNKQVLACVDEITGLLRYQASGICATNTGPVNWLLKGQGVSTNVDNAVKKGVSQIISLIPTGAGGTAASTGTGTAGTSNSAGSTKTVTTSPATNTSSAITTTTTTPTNPTTTVSTAITTTTSSTTTTTIASRASGSLAGYLGGNCPDGSGIPWYWGSGGQARAGGCSAAASIAPISTGSSGSTGGSGSTATTTTTVAPIVVPGTPATPTGVAGNLQVTVSVAAGSGGTPTSYTVTQSTTSGGTYSTGCTITGASGSCVITGLTNGTTYFFKTTATNSVGTSSLSTASSSVTPAVTVPDAPTIGTASGASATSVTVACTAPTSNGGATITTYTFTSSPAGGTATLTSATCSTTTVTGLTAGTAYTFTVTATNSQGTSVASAASNSVTPVIPTVPGAPTIGTATVASGTSVTVACTTPSSNGGATITTYTATSSPGGITGTLTSATCSSAITVSGLTSGTTYTFTVTATNSVGASVASSASNSVTPRTCATGGTCIVGDTGPGGGTVFYVRASGGTFTSTGSDCNTACKYFEVVSSADQASKVWATTTAFCYATGSDSGSSSCQSNSIYSNTSGQAASRTASEAIGMGMANTNQIYARVTTASGLTNTADYPAGIAFDYTNNGKTDWHLPSKDELNQLCKWNRGVAWTSDATVCTGGTMNSATFGASSSGFTAFSNYWSSSEFADFQGFRQIFPSTPSGFGKTNAFITRSVRAFG